MSIHQNVNKIKCIYTLNDVGTFEWENLKAPASFRSLVTALEDEFDADCETIVDDLGTFLQELEPCMALLREVN